MTITLTKVDNTLIALDNNVPIGTILFEKSFKSLHVRQITVADAYQRQGIGTRLVEDLRLRFPEQVLWGEILTDYAASFWRNWDKEIPTEDIQDWINNYGVFDIKPLKVIINS